MADPRRPDDIRDTSTRSGPRTGAGDGAAYRGGYGAGGLGSGGERVSEGGAPAEPPAWDAPGVTPDGVRTGAAEDGPRIAHGEESQPDPDLPEDDA